MYDIKQFRTALYLLIALGISGFALSSQSPGLWVFAMALVGLNAWLMKTRQFRPLPRIVANAAALLAIAYVLVGFSGASASPILAIGQFLVILQLVKLWEQRANRDYAQLLILSLLLMVSAAISTYSLIFGVMFIIYLFLSLYCCLLFHLKAETDDARAALAVPEQRVNLNTLRQDQYHLPSSMRRLTGLVSAFAITFAVIVFLVFPRGPGANMFGQFQWRHTESLTGFSEQVSFQQVAKISQNYDEVATVKLWKNGQLVAGTEPLLLRGLTHEVYNGDDTEHGGAYQWSRTVGSSKSDEPPQDFDSMGDWHPRDAQNNEVYRQEIKLAPTGTPVIFSIGGPVRFSPGPIPGALRKMKLGYSAADEVFMASDAIPQPLTYTMMASGELGNEAPSLDPAQRKSKIDPLISQYARRPEVSGVGLLARREALVGAMPRDLPQVTDLDEQIAKNIETHLRTTFRYTLDLTEAERIQGQDPVVAFLYNFKRGHCEYFAGAMTLLCQSLGMQARMAVGFKCDDYNNYGHYYSVKQSHAHAWVEVYTTHGWKTFDPTSGRESALIAQSTWDKARHLFNFMEYTWANAVIAYDSNNRDNILQRVDTGLTNSAIRGSFALIRVRDFFNWVGETIGTKFVAPIIGILVLAMLVLLGWFLFERFKIRKRVSRIGIQSLPASAQMRLVRQLGFYDELLQLLERYDIVREKHFTPLEFSDSLAFLPTEIYSTVQRLTGLFYKIRFGHAELDAGRQRRLAVVINRLSECLARERELVAISGCHMNAIILSVGDELVLGQTVDTNSAWTSQQLAAIGCDIAGHATVPDDQSRIEQAIRDATPRCDFLIISGGIGPTEDDLTRQALAAVLNEPLELNQEWSGKLEAFFQKVGRTMPESNRIQAMIPRGVKMILNSAGTASGMDASFQSGDLKTRCRIFVMPGVPKEMKTMFTNDVFPHLAVATGGAVIISRTLHTFGMGESSVAQKLGTLMERKRNPSVGTTVANGIVSLRVNARFSSREEAQSEMEKTVAACKEALGDLIFGSDDEVLPAVIAKLLTAGEKPLTVATAESCTGGLLAKMLTDLSGSSAYFTQGWVTYSNKAKYERLGVSMDIINVNGAVSEPVVEAMAKHARRLAGTHFALSISGVAGPTGGSATKPVGTVCIGMAEVDPSDKKQSIVTTRTFTFPGDREMIRDRSSKMALSMLRFRLLNQPMPF